MYKYCAQYLVQNKGCSKGVAYDERISKSQLPTYQIRTMKLLEVPFFGMFSPINGERCSAAPKAWPKILISNCCILRNNNPRKSNDCWYSSSNSPATPTCNWDQLFDCWSSMRSPNGQVDAVTPQDPSSHYTTRTGDDKTKIPNTGTIENTDNGNSVNLDSGVCR